MGLEEWGVKDGVGGVWGGGGQGLMQSVGGGLWQERESKISKKVRGDEGKGPLSLVG